MTKNGEKAWEMIGQISTENCQLLTESFRE